MIVGHYNEYLLPNNDFLYKHDFNVTLLRSKKNMKKFKMELSEKYGTKTVHSQPIFFNGVKTCVLAYIHTPFGNPSSIHYFLDYLKNNGLSEEEHEPFTIEEIYDTFRKNNNLIHIYNFGLISGEDDWIVFQAHFMNHLYSIDLSIDFTKKIKVKP